MASLRALSSSLRRVASRAASTRAAGSVLVTGANGQIGIELVKVLRERYGESSVLATDVRPPPSASSPGPFAYLDVTDDAAWSRLIVEHGVTRIVHLASLLSAVGEKQPLLAQRVNVRGCELALESARNFNCSIFIPSTIAVFGPSTPRDGTPNECVMTPRTMYGVSKVYMELLGQYYAHRFGVDFRSIRYPGIISHAGEPGGGTTDYAVDIFYSALSSGGYTCFLRGDSALPMMYMPDCLKGTMDLMHAPREALSTRVYNLTAVSFTPEEIGAEVRKRMPGFKLRYSEGVDPRQGIADSWPRSIDDSAARKDWGWSPQYDLPAMCDDMLRNVAVKLGVKYSPQ